jgi:hypothetical protein
VLLCPELLHHLGIGVLHDCVCFSILLHQGLSTTLFPATTPRLQLITPPKRSNTTPKCQTTSLPRSIQPQLRRPNITQSRLTTQKLLLRTKLNRNTTLMLQFTTPQPTQNLATTPRHGVALKYYTEGTAYYTTTYAAIVYYTEKP